MQKNQMIPKATHVIVQVNQKGGCGKTTTTLNLAAALAEIGIKVCCVDLDEQCNLCTGLGFDVNAHKNDGGFSSLDIFVKKRDAKQIAVPSCNENKEHRFNGNLYLIPGHRQLNSTEAHLDGERHATQLQENASELDADELREEQRQRLRVSLDTLRDEFDVVLIDTQPNLGYLTTSALIAADWILVPVFPSGYDLDGLNKLKVIRRKVAERYNPNLSFLGVLLGRFDATTKLDEDIYQMLCDIFPEKVFSTKIYDSVRQREAPIHGISSLEHAPTHQTTEQFRMLAREVLTRLHESELKARAAYDSSLTRMEVNA